jgi:ribosomal protein L28
VRLSGSFLLSTILTGCSTTSAPQISHSITDTVDAFAGRLSETETAMRLLGQKRALWVSAKGRKQTVRCSRVWPRLSKLGKTRL